MKPKFKILFSDVGGLIALFRRKESAVRVDGGSWSGARVGITVGEQLFWFLNSIFHSVGMEVMRP